MISRRRLAIWLARLVALVVGGLFVYLGIEAIVTGAASISYNKGPRQQLTGSAAQVFGWGVVCIGLAAISMMRFTFLRRLRFRDFVLTFGLFVLGVVMVLRAPRFG